jgi:2-(1,2-epoxy-1,2-dihydrophenyl)acetyl-CoA isomerase
MEDLVLYDVVDGVARIELNRPQAANSLDLDLVRALRAAVDRAADDPAVHAVAVTGAGARFCAGGDVGAFHAAADPAAYLRQLATEADDAMRALAQLAKPVVAGVHGAVAGAGLALVLSCDLVVAAPATVFVFAYPSIGLTPDCGVSWLLPRAVGQQRALELALTGRRLSAVEAVDWGLVTRVADEPATTAREIAGALASGPAAAHGLARRLLRAAWETDRVAAGEEEARTIADRIRSDEASLLIDRFVSATTPPLDPCASM